MTSEKIRALKAMLSLARSGQLFRNRGLIGLVQLQLGAIHEEVVALEQAQVPAPSRLPATLAQAARHPRLGAPANDRRRR
jgi:hypothetical protein